MTFRESLPLLHPAPAHLPEAAPSLAALHAVLDAIGPAAIAVSGGIDSLTLATAAHRRGTGVVMHHAVSPAVPPEATARTRALAEREGWTLDIFDAGEFDDPRYRENPVNRCFFCKTSLYGSIGQRSTRTILSGTNVDDLGEYRPGLDAASRHGVRHPFVEAGFRKADIRRLAASLGLGALSALPASPCLASRVETGIAITAPDLATVHRVERLVADRIAPATVRCRIRRAGVSIELDEASLTALAAEQRMAIAREIAALGITRPVGFAAYRNGSAFLRDAE